MQAEILVLLQQVLILAPASLHLGYGCANLDRLILVLLY